MRVNKKKSFYESFTDNLRAESMLKESYIKKVDEDNLEPKYSNRRSFYGKADVRTEGDAKILRSYDTDVVKIEGDEITVLCEPKDLTQTTLRHIREFLQQEGFEPLTKQELLKLADGEDLKESYNDLDVDVHLLTNRRDYSIIDMSEVVDKKDGDVLPPMEDIATLLVGADEDLTESYGSDWGHINIQSTRLYEADRSSNALLELRLPGNKNYLMSMILNESDSGKTLKVNNTLGKTIFQRKTNDPKRAIVEYIQQYLPANLNEAKKEGKDSYKNEIESLLTSNTGYANLYAHYQEVLAMVNVYNDLEDEEKEVMKKIVSRLAYSFVPELSSKIYPKNPNEEDGTEYPTFDKMVEDLFGKDWVREPEEQKQYKVDDLEFKEIGSDLSESCRLVETTNKGIEAKEQDLYDRIRQALKDAGDEDWENIAGYTKRLPKDVVAEFVKEENEIGCIRMIHSILTYTSNRNVDELINNRYLEKYIDEFGEDKVRELLVNEIDEYSKATINQNVYTDSEGLTYNSVTFSDDLDESNLKEADGEEVPTEEPEAEVEPTNTDDLNTNVPKQGLGTGYATFVRHPKDLADVRNSVKQGITDGKASYIVCSIERLSSEEFDDLCNNLTVDRDFCTRFTPIDDVNYAFNCIQVEGDGKNFKLLIDPSGFAYPRWVAVLDNK